MQELDAILEETTAALATFDLDALLELLQRAEVLRHAGCKAVSRPVVAKHQVLSAMLRSTESNLKLIERLHRREAERTWER
jgi:hypothetical protein